MIIDMKVAPPLGRASATGTIIDDDTRGLAFSKDIFTVTEATGPQAHRNLHRRADESTHRRGDGESFLRQHRCSHCLTRYARLHSRKLERSTDGYDNGG